MLKTLAAAAFVVGWPRAAGANDAPQRPELSMQALCDRADRHPAAAFELIARSNEEDKNRWACAVVSHLAGRDPALARPYLGRLQPGIDRDWTLKTLAQREADRGDLRGFATARGIDDDPMRAETLALAAFAFPRGASGKPDEAALRAAHASMEIALRLRGRRDLGTLPTRVIPPLHAVIPDEVGTYVAGIEPEWWYGSEAECLLHRAAVWSFVDRAKSDEYFRSVPEKTLKSAIRPGCIAISVDADLEVYIVGLACQSPELAAERFLAVCSLRDIHPIAQRAAIANIVDIFVPSMMAEMAELVRKYAPASFPAFAKCLMVDANRPARRR